MWTQLAAHIEDRLGPITWASLVGSRRYNLHVPGSDYDYMIVCVVVCTRLLVCVVLCSTSAASVTQRELGAVCTVAVPAHRYQAPTPAVLGLEAPPALVKNNPGTKPDFTGTAAWCASPHVAIHAFLTRRTVCSSA